MSYYERRPHPVPARAGARVHRLRSLVLVGDGADLAQPLLPARGDRGRPQDQPADGAVAAAHDLGAHGRPLLDRPRTTTRAGCPGTRWRSRPRASRATTRSRPRRSTTSIADAAAGELPNLAIIDPDFEANDGHPPHDLALCEAFVASVYRALAESPQWSRSLLVVHVRRARRLLRSRAAAADRRSRTPSSGSSGFRVPAIVVGPAGAAGRGGVDAVRARLDRGDAGDAVRDRQPGPAHGRRRRSVVVPRSRTRSSRRRRRCRRSRSANRARCARRCARPASRRCTRWRRPTACPTGTSIRAPARSACAAWLRHAQELESVRVIA